MFDINKCYDSFATQPDTAYFWSGLGHNGADIAAEVAQNNGGVTLEMVMDQNKDALIDAGFPYDIDLGGFYYTRENAGNWEDASRAFAEQASGDVHAVLGDNVREGSIWNTQELPALSENDNVGKITSVDPVTGNEKDVLLDKTNIPTNEVQGLQNDTPLDNNPLNLAAPQEPYDKEAGPSDVDGLQSNQPSENENLNNPNSNDPPVHEPNHPSEEPPVDHDKLAGPSEADGPHSDAPIEVGNQNDSIAEPSPHEGEQSSDPQNAEDSFPAGPSEGDLFDNSPNEHPSDPHTPDDTSPAGSSEEDLFGDQSPEDGAQRDPAEDASTFDEGETPNENIPIDEATPAGPSEDDLQDNAPTENGIENGSTDEGLSADSPEQSDDPQGLDDPTPAGPSEEDGVLGESPADEPMQGEPEAAGPQDGTNFSDSLPIGDEQGAPPDNNVSLPQEAPEGPTMPMTGGIE